MRNQTAARCAPVLFVCLILCFGVPAFANQYSLSIPEDVALTVNLSEEPKAFEGPLYQYALVLGDWDRKEVYENLEPFIASSIRDDKQATLDREHFHFQHPQMPLRSGSTGGLFLYLMQNKVVQRDDIEARLLTMMKTIGWNEYPWVEGVMSREEYIYANQKYKPKYSPERTLDYHWSNETAYIASVGRTIAGYRLTKSMENILDDYFVGNMADLMLDAQGQLLYACIPRPWRIISKQMIQEPLLSWQECFPLLVRSIKQTTGPFGIKESNKSADGYTYWKQQSELIAVEPMYLVRNLDNGRFIAVPAWQMTIKTHNYIVYNQELREFYGMEHFENIRYSHYVFNALTGEES